MTDSTNFSSRFKRMESFIQQLQDEICQALEKKDSRKFQEDCWKRKEGGGGRTRVLENGSFLEKGGVNISSVHGPMSDELAKQLGTKASFFGACGISLVLHPQSPKIPTVHMNLRYFETLSGDCWYGGGIDLTPYFPYPEDFRHFHHILQQVCERCIPNSYEEYKKNCDEYFSLPHRQEMRGIGGIFFDHLNGSEEKYFNLVNEVGEEFLNAYMPLVDRRINEEWNDEDVEFQYYRRGRYVEFNLIYDRGTLFGIKSNGRIESIFMSLPPKVDFRYNWEPRENSPHHEMNGFYQPQNWC